MDDTAGRRKPTAAEDYERYYDLESYLFKIVHERFRCQGYLEAFDFFCIVIWKANRAKSKIARKLLNQPKRTLDEAVIDLTKRIAAQESPKDRLRLLMNAELKFRLPMASAILTVLYPDEFTVYDIRVCESLGMFQELTNITNFDNLWERYIKFKSCVDSNAPQGYSLRDKDRYLWGKSFYNQLRGDIENMFKTAEIGLEETPDVLEAGEPT